MGAICVLKKMGPVTDCLAHRLPKQTDFRETVQEILSSASTKETISVDDLNINRCSQNKSSFN